MGIYIETLILYVVLFFAGSASMFTGAPVDGEPGSFLAAAELKRLFLYSVPSLVLVWYLLLRARKISAWGILPGKKDLISGLITLPCLLIIGFIIAFISSQTGETPVQITLHSPSTASGWLLLCVSCTAAAYLEESFFRFFILSRRDELHLSAISALILSVTLFSICHIYEGPWGFLNAVLSGTLLCFVFLRYKSLHGIAIAHSLYNIAVYVINAILN
jgi:membrane protease YdiL (CAAX protease family)